MIIKKITVGYVIQEFDTDKKTFVHQEFVAGDTVNYDLEDGTPCLPITVKQKLEQHYLCFEMKQPDEMTLNKKRTSGRNGK